MVMIAPSILSADFGSLANEVQMVLEGGADWIHVDVMDGAFVPNITMGPIVVNALRRRFDAHLDVHLMIQSPERYIADFADAGASSISVHAEATPHIHRALQQIRQRGLPAGLALNPGTGIESIRHCIGLVDYVLVMTVNPGFGGQSFIPEMLNKIRSVRALLDDASRPDIPIEVDGGITEKNIQDVVQAGASIFVAGSAIYGAQDYREAISGLRGAAEQGR